MTASPPPAGKFPVVFHPSVAGLLTHEAIGHNAEADHIVSGTSIIAGKLGTQIASELVTIVDDSTIPGKWGSYRYDSEGTPGARRVLVEKGVLKGYMNSLETAAKLGVVAQRQRPRPELLEPSDRADEQYIYRAGVGFARGNAARASTWVFISKERSMAMYSASGGSSPATRGRPI